MKRVNFKFDSPALRDSESINFRTPVVRYSYKKLVFISRHLTRYSLDDVMTMLLFMNKKPCLIFLKSLKTFKNNITVNNVKNNIEKTDFSAFIVKGITVEKTFRTHSIRYHGKGNFAITDTNFCRLKFEFHILNN